MSDLERVMIDIETLGREPGCVVLSIGAVKFDTEGIHDEFYRNIDVKTCTVHDLEIEADTLCWWLEQNDEAQDVLTGGDGLMDTFRAFNDFYGDADEVWARSPHFDCSILEAAYDAVGGEAPWSFRDTRCCRTLEAVSDVEEIERRGEHHNALADAKHQARMVILELQEVLADA